MSSAAEFNLDMFLSGFSLLVTVISAFLISWLAIRFVVRRFNLYGFYPRDVFEYFEHMFGIYPDDIDREAAERHFRCLHHPVDCSVVEFCWHCIAVAVFRNPESLRSWIGQRMTSLKWVLLFAACVYVGGVALLYLAQRTIMYPVPQKVRVSPADAGFPQAQEVILDIQDGEKIIAWHVPPLGNKPVVIFFHGNGDILAWREPRFRKLTEDGTGLIAVSFRGYGGSSGQPSESGLLFDGDAAYRFATTLYPPQRIVPWGYSLGSGVAVALAATHPVGKLILEAPYSSTVDVAAAMYPFIPVRWLLRDQFHSDERIAKVTAPLLVMHGEKDSVIAIRFGEKLFDLAPGPKRLVRFPLGTHVNLYDFGAIETAHAFLAEPN
jgi:pimeloyl-ACP methyl ester carboxylesterase